MTLHQVYINKAAKFLPNAPISNDEMEEYLGFVNGQPSKSRRIVLRNNGIKRRFYARDKEGNATHTNYEMTALAIKSLFSDSTLPMKELQLLSCGTSSPDQMMPSHAVMVHGELKDSSAIEVVSPSGVCCAGMHALKYAYMAIKCGEVENAVSAGSERISALIKSSYFENEVANLALLEENPYLSFDKDFLRWMLSDGAAAFLLQNKPSENGLSLRIDWIEGVSYAHQVESCMYMASDKRADGTLESYVDIAPGEILNKSVMSIKQDVKLLSEHIVPLGFDKLKDILDKKEMNINDIDYFLPHMSSEFFRSKIAENLNSNGLHIPNEKWFTNLTSVGNVGAGSIYLMIEEILNSGTLKKGQKLLLVVPESSRFSYVFSLLTVC
ncbi:MAG: beta-ketoacyl-ACP synthase III [Bacteroidota bacterium]